MKRVDWKFSDHSGSHEDPTTFAILTVLRRMLFGLCNSPPNLLSKSCLVQIWMTGADHKTLLAKDSLYGVADEHGSRHLQLYREESSKNEIAKDMTNHFLHFSDRPNYLLYELAKRCVIQGSKILPVFKKKSPEGPCIAVIELVTTRRDPDFGIEEYKEIKRELEKVDLTTSNNVEYFFAQQGPSSAVQGLQEEPCSPKISTKKGKEVLLNSDSQFHEATQNHNGPNKDITGTSHAQDLVEPCSLVRSSRKGKEAVNSDCQFHEATLNHNGPNKDMAGTSCAQDQDEPCSLVILPRKGKEKVNTDCKFHEATQNHNRPNKVCRESTIGSPSSNKTPIVSARQKNPRIIGIFRLKSAFTIEGLRRSIAKKFNWDDNAGFNFDLHSVNKQNERDFLIDNDDKVKKLFCDHSVVFVIDVQTQKVPEGDRSAKRTERCRDPDTRRGVKLHINGNGFKMAYEAVNRKFKPGERDKMMENIIDASLSSVKKLRRKFCSYPVVSMPSTLDGLGNGEAARHKKMRTGESSSALDILRNSNVNKHASLYGGQQETQHSASEFSSNMEVSVEKTQVMSAETAHGAEQQTQPSEQDSALRMEEITSDTVVTSAEKNRDMSAETANVPEQELPQYVEPVSDNWQMEGNEYPGTIGVGIGDANQLVFYDGNGKELDASHDHNGIGDISTVEFTSTVPLGEEIDRNKLEVPISPPGEYIDWSDFDLASILDEIHE